MGNTVKIDNLAIFKATVEANGLETMYDPDTDKVASATIGTLAEGAKTGPAVKVIKLLAQSTGEFTRDELKKDVKLGWTDKTKAEIAATKGDSSAAGGASSGSGTEGGNGSSQQGGNSQQGSSQNGGQSQQSGFALTISTSGSGSSTVTLNGSAVSSGASLNEGIGDRAGSSASATTT